mgnify:CR=1 FL=1
MDTPTFTSADGFNLRLKYFSLQETYLSLLEGQPCAEINEDILEELQHGKHWYNTNPCIQMPAGYTTQQTLPQYMLTLSLEGKPLDPQFGGAACNLVVFVNQAYEQELQTLITNAVQELKWQNNAKNFDY